MNCPAERSKRCLATPGDSAEQFEHRARTGDGSDSRPSPQLTEHEQWVAGLPGSGKTHLLCAIAQELVRQGRPAYFRRCSLLVQELLQAEQELRLSRLLKKWGSYEIMVIDDLGYVQQNREEMEVLFTFFAERYERGSVLLTSNLPFSKWEQIFRDPMTTAAAIDRLVHHSVIMELNLPSYRAEQAKKGKEKRTGEAPKEAG